METNKPSPGAGLLFLAPAALVFLPAFTLAWVATEHDENYEWTQHRLTAVLLFAAFVSALLFGTWKHGKLTFAFSLLSLGFAVAALAYGAADFNWVLAVAAIFVVTAYYFSDGTARNRLSLGFRVEIGALFLSTSLSFWMSSRLSWWGSFEDASSSWGMKLLFLAISALMAYATSAMLRAKKNTPTSWKWLTRFIDTCALLVLAAAVVRTGALARSLGFAHHWSVFVTPAELVREGHILLGEVPSQYGFLSTLLLAFIPTNDCYTALFIANSFLLWVSGAVVYFSLRTLLPRWWWQVISAVLTVCGVAMICGSSNLSGPMTYPSTGGMRFIWVHALVGFLIWHQLKPEPTEKPFLFLRIGTALWLVGVFWSVESAAYVTAIWFPAASILAGPNHGAGSSAIERCKRLLLGVFRVIAMAALFMGFAVLAVEFFYRLHLGRAPEWSTYWEYAAAFSNGFGVLPIDPEGGVWELLLLHGSLLASIVSFDIDQRRRSVALIWGAWGALWSVSTYYVSRSHGSNITNLIPILLLVIAAFAHVCRSESDKSPARLWLWTTMPAFLTTILWLVFSQPTAIKLQIAQYSIEPHTARLRPPASEALIDLIEECRKRIPDPYSVVAPAATDTVSVDHSAKNPAWIPIDSLPLLQPLPVKTRLHYLDIYTDHGRKPGWLISFVPQHESTEWIFEYTSAHYATDLVLTNSNWLARHYVPRKKN